MPRTGAAAGDSREEETVVPVTTELPPCRKCGNGQLLPMSDYGRDGAPITFKAWVCSNPDCGFNIRIDNGELSFGRALGQSHK
jgi:hypothetical protein